MGGGGRSRLSGGYGTTSQFRCFISDFPRVESLKKDATLRLRSHDLPRLTKAITVLHVMLHPTRSLRHLQPERSAMRKELVLQQQRLTREQRRKIAPIRISPRVTRSGGVCDSMGRAEKGWLGRKWPSERPTTPSPPIKTPPAGSGSLHSTDPNDGSPHPPPPEPRSSVLMDCEDFLWRLLPDTLHSMIF